MTAPMRPPTRRLILLGSTGSIGTSTLEVVAHLHRIGAASFEVIGLAAGANADLLLEQAQRFSVSNIAIANNGPPSPRGRGNIFTGPDAALRLIESVARRGDFVVGAMVGAAGIPATIAAIERGCDIALANKETLVAAGALVMPLARERGVNIIPVDSEHSAIFQCLAGPSAVGCRPSAPSDRPRADCREPSAIARIIITASGGPFRTWPAERIERATVAEALNHPTWSMGPKVTIDSASLMNKALEMIEAHWLFDLPSGKIDVLVHPQSIVHGLVEFADGSTIAQLGAPDMKTPIQYALTWPDCRAEGCSKRIDWATLRRMDFEPVDHDRFGAVKLAYRAIDAGGTAGAVLNAANEAAVAAFIAGHIPFGRITPLVREAIDAVAPAPVRSLEDVYKADAAARDYVRQSLEALHSV
jgi:1-deoxy-D-xylulose-5-phosphate reductoisomerase